MDETTEQPTVALSPREARLVVTVEQLIELRRQNIRRYVTIVTASAYALLVAFVVVIKGDISPLDGLLGVVGTLVGFYFGGR